MLGRCGQFHEHTCNLQEGAFLPYFSMKIPSNRPVTTYKFLVRTWCDSLRCCNSEMVLPHCHESYALMISYDHLCIRFNWNTLATCKRVLFCLTFPWRFHPIAQSQPTSFWYESCRNRNEPKWNLWDAHHRNLTRASSLAMFCFASQLLPVVHPGRRRESRSERLGRCGQFHVQLGLRVHCQTSEAISIAGKRNRESSWFLSAWRFMVRQP